MVMTTPKYGGDDAEAGQGIRDGGERPDRQRGFVMVNVHVVFDHLVGVKGLDASAGSHADGIADERQRVMVFQEFRILRENGALVRVVTVGFQGHQAVAARAAEEFEHHFQRFEIPLLVVFRAAKRAGDAGNDFLQDMEGIRDEHGAERGAADGYQFGGLDQHPQIAVFHQEPANHRAEDHDDSDNYEHRMPVLPRILLIGDLHLIAACRDALGERFLGALHDRFLCIARTRGRSAK